VSSFTFPVSELAGGAWRAREPGFDFSGVAKPHDQGLIQPREHLAPVPKVSAKGMGYDRVRSDENVAPGLDVAIPQDLPRPHAPPGSPQEPQELYGKRQV